jgi:hypothetical protein
LGTRSEELAEKVEQANSDLLATAEKTSDEQWTAKCADGEWTQGFAAWHAGNSIGFVSGMVQDLASGAPFTPTTMAAIDQNNAEANRDHANCTKAEAIDAIKQNAPAAAQLVRSLSDEQLDRKATLLEGMPEFSVQQVIEMLLIGHPQGHTQSITNAR